jgi:hypothetical protein
MAEYRRLKPFFASGVFYGIDEFTHVHRNREKTGAVINCFNLGKQPTKRQIRFDPAEFGLMPAPYSFVGATFQRAGTAYLLDVRIPAVGASIVEVHP